MKLRMCFYGTADKIMKGITKEPLYGWLRSRDHLYTSFVSVMIRQGCHPIL